MQIKTGHYSGYLDIVKFGYYLVSYTNKRHIAKTLDISLKTYLHNFARHAFHQILCLPVTLILE